MCGSNELDDKSDHNCCMTDAEFWTFSHLVLGLDSTQNSMGTGNEGHKQLNHSFANMLLADFTTITNPHPVISSEIADNQQALVCALARWEASNIYANLQSEYAGNLAKIKTLKWRMDAWDMISPFVIPDFIVIDPYALSVENRWGNRKLTGVNLLKNWGKLTLKQCRNWQRDSFDYACAEDLTSMEWAKSLMTNSGDVLLIDRTNKKFDELDLYKQGGLTYIKIALDEMFTISNTVRGCTGDFPK